MKSSFKSFIAGGMTVLGVLMYVSHKCQLDQWMKTMNDASCGMRQKFKDMNMPKEDCHCHES